MKDLAQLSVLPFLCIMIMIFPSCRNNSDANNAKNERLLIKTERLSERIMVIRLGWDAITAISTKKGIVVIDAGISNSLTTRYKKLIEAEFGRYDFAYLINTHSHPDHVGGNQAFSDDAIIIGHENVPREMEQYFNNTEAVKTGLGKIVKDYEKQIELLDQNSKEWEEVLSQKLRYKYAYDDMLLGMTIPEPSITFSDRMCLQMGDVTFYLVYFGRAHTESDILIYVPEEKTLFTGDLFSHGGKSWIGDSENADVERWKNVIDSIMINNNQIKVIISGHGEVMSESDLESFRSFVNEQWEKVKGI